MCVCARARVRVCTHGRAHVLYHEPMVKTYSIFLSPISEYIFRSHVIVFPPQFIFPQEFLSFFLNSSHSVSGSL